MRICLCSVAQLNYAARKFSESCEALDLPQSAEQFGQDLTDVHSFYLLLLETALGHEVPVPQAISHDPDVLRRFVLLMDLAVSPQMIRDGLRSAEYRRSGEALLRFFAAKAHRRNEDRDKVDVTASALYRLYAPKRAADAEEDEVAEAIENFEQELQRIYGDQPMAEPANEHMQLVREFQFLRAEVTDFRHFDELIDSGLIQRVRDIKQTLDASFPHPAVLATVASYNVYFGETFDALFKRAANEVKTFAAKVQQDGGSIMSRVDGDVIVKHLTDVDEGKILNEEYSRAQEDLRHISKLKKAVDNRRFGKMTAPAKETVPTPPATRVPGTSLGGAPPIVPLADSVSAKESPHSARPLGRPPIESPAYVMPRTSANVAERELQRLQNVQGTIRRFVRSADSNASHVVPLPNGNVTLTTSEVEAFRTDYGEEKSFRADFASALTQLAAVDARLAEEWHEFQKTRLTAYNWKIHADALAHLLGVAQSFSENAKRVSALAQQRGLHEKVAAIAESLEKVRARSQAATEALQSIGPTSE